MVEIQLGGETRHLVYRMVDILDLERTCPRREDVSVTLDWICWATFYGLRAAQPTLSPKKVEKWVEEYLKAPGGYLSGLCKIIDKALGETGFYKDEGDEESPNPQAS